MYYPYFRGKQFELIVLRDNAQFLADNNIHPIIEPVKDDFTAIKRAMAMIDEVNAEITVIVNPRVGEIPVKSSKILEELFEDAFEEYDNICMGYMLHAESDPVQMVELLKRYPDRDFTLVHYGFTNSREVSAAIAEYANVKNHVFIDGFAGKLYQRQFKSENTKRILIRDGFKSQKKNALYPPSEHFSDLHLTYPDEGMDGFGDFLIVGDDYTETGGPAYAVAIHLTYLNEDDDMYIYHFLSDQNSSPTDPGGKFIEALHKLVKESKRPKSPIYQSTACQELLSLYDKKHYPGLGHVKKLSMQHHLELIVKHIRSVE
jgi:hypothetical protein